ncbi:acyltransferase family protein [Muricoccus radiodurans]|uniref:acyltransferase family protein n=1 Tax=Muricoccus radiodurans TaxID=2231721 RepID=UPI003CEDD50E
MTAPAPPLGRGGGGHIAALDGLRLAAFLLVLVHHLPVAVDSAALRSVQLRGWVGVELFFVLSAYLFFHHFRREWARTGGISLGRFWLRRLLRLYPLMIGFPLAAMLLWGHPGAEAWLRLAGLALFADNVIAWFARYNGAIPDAPHLWTLSFEFQLYLVIPFAFLAFMRLGWRRFVLGLGAVWLFCTALRLVVAGLGAPHPVVWVTPFLRPDTVLVGMLLGTLVPTDGRLRLPMPGLLAAGAAVLAAGAVFFQLPVLFEFAGAASVYPVAALLCGGLLVLALGWAPLRGALAATPVAYLGRISFGLYVYHLLAVRLVLLALPVPAGQFVGWGAYGLRFAATLGLTTAMAAASYHLLERPFLRLKDRLHGPEGAAAPDVRGMRASPVP